MKSRRGNCVGRGNIGPFRGGRTDNLSVFNGDEAVAKLLKTNVNMFLIKMLGKVVKLASVNISDEGLLKEVSVDVETQLFNWATYCLV